MKICLNCRQLKLYKQQSFYKNELENRDIYNALRPAYMLFEPVMHKSVMS